MTTRQLAARVAALAAGWTPAADLAAEAAAYGHLEWSTRGTRCYTGSTPDGATLTIAGAGGPLTYKIIGVDAL